MELLIEAGHLPDASLQTLASRTRKEWLLTPNIGPKKVQEIERILVSNGLGFAVIDPRL